MGVNSSQKRSCALLLVITLLLSASSALAEPTLDLSENGSPIASAGAGAPGTAGSLTRVAGADRYITAIEASKANFESADNVILATGIGYADALSASALAGALDAPLLLTHPGSLGDGVLAEVRRLGAKKAYVMGSAVAVSDAVGGSLISAGLAVERVAGTDRYATSAAVAKKVAELEGAAFVKKAFLARGDDFADGLAVSPLAYHNRIPVLLTRPTSLPAPVGDAITCLGITDVTVLGLTAAITSGVEASVGGIATTRRVAGDNRYETAQRIAEYAFENSLAAKDFIGVATGLDFPDALAGGAATGKHGGILVLTEPGGLSRGWAICLSGAYESIKPDIQLYGGSNVVSDNVSGRLQDILLRFSSYPLEKRDAVPDGTRIPFTVSQVWEQMWEEEQGYSFFKRVLVLESMDELDAFLRTSEEVSHTYDQAFFEDSVIIVIFPPGIDSMCVSGSVRTQIDSLTRSDNEVCIGATVTHGEAVTDDMHHYYIMIDVGKADIEGVDGFSCFMKYDAR